MGQIETALAQEAATPRGYNIPVPDPKQASGLTRDLRTSRGGLSLTPSVASDAAWGAGQESKPADDWVSKRFGFFASAVYGGAAVESFGAFYSGGVRVCQ